MTKAEHIEANAAKLRELHRAVHETFSSRHLGTAEKELWHEACRRFHESFDQLAFPGGLGEGFRRLAANDPGAIESAVVFLEVDPFFDCSGYIKENLLGRLRRVVLDPDQKRRLQQVIFARIRDPRTRREFRRYCQLAPFITDPQFEEQVSQLSGPSGVKPKHARWVLEHIKQAQRMRR